LRIFLRSLLWQSKSVTIPRERAPLSSLVISEEGNRFVSELRLIPCIWTENSRLLHSV
jgi:hypothetical protein